MGVYLGKTKVSPIQNTYTGTRPDATLITKEISSNGVYKASEDNADGYSKVTVNVASNLQEKTATPTTLQQIVQPDAGYTGLSKVTVNGVNNSIDSNIIPENIKKDVNILGVTGTLESEIRPQLDPLRIKTPFVAGERINAGDRMILCGELGKNTTYTGINTPIGKEFLIYNDDRTAAYKIIFAGSKVSVAKSFDANSTEGTEEDYVISDNNFPVTRSDTVIQLANNYFFIWNYYSNDVNVRNKAVIYKVELNYTNLQESTINNVGSYLTYSDLTTNDYPSSGASFRPILSIQGIVRHGANSVLLYNAYNTGTIENDQEPTKGVYALILNISSNSVVFKKIAEDISTGNRISNTYFICNIHNEILYGISILTLRHILTFSINLTDNTVDSAISDEYSPGFVYYNDVGEVYVESDGSIYTHMNRYNFNEQYKKLFYKMCKLNSNLYSSTLKTIANEIQSLTESKFNITDIELMNKFSNYVKLHRLNEYGPIDSGKSELNSYFPDVLPFEHTPVDSTTVNKIEMVYDFDDFSKAYLNITGKINDNYYGHQGRVVALKGLQNKWYYTNKNCAIQYDLNNDNMIETYPEFIPGSNYYIIADRDYNIGDNIYL